MIEQSKTEKSSHEIAWTAAIRMLRGDQWIYYGGRAGGARAPRPPQEPTGGGDLFDTIPRKRGHVRLTINHMMNIARNIEARLVMANPKAVVMPASDSVDDVTKATGSEVALAYYWYADKMRQKMSTAIRWLVQCGNVGLHTYYEPGEQEQVTESVKEVEPGESEANTEGVEKSAPTPKKVKMGSVRTEVVSPFDIFFERGVVSAAESRWVAIRTYSTLGELKDLYPSKSAEIEEISVSPGQGQNGESDVPNGRIEVFEIYWRDGRHAISAGNTYLVTEYKAMYAKKFPVQHIKYFTVEGVLWGVGPMEQIADLQQLYNRSRTQIHANIRLMGNPPWLVPRTADVKKGMLFNKPGGIVHYTPGGGAPTPAPPQMLPNHVVQEPGVLREEMSDVAGAHGITLGRREPGVKSGVHARTLAEQDSSQMAVTRSSIEDALVEVFECVLMLMKEHYTESKVVRMMDNLGRAVWRSISQQNIVDDPEVHIDAPSMFVRDSLARDKQVLELAQLGLISPDMALEEMSFRTANSYVTKKFQALSHAKDMLEAVLHGRTIEVLPSDDMEAFEKVFSEFMQTDDYYKASPMIQDYIRTILVDVTSIGMPPEQYEQMLATRTIHPKQQPKQSAPGGTLPGVAPQLQDTAQPAPGIGADPLVNQLTPQGGQTPPGVPIITPPMQ
jgi:hypothetical protein